MYVHIIKSIASKKIGIYPHPHFVTFFTTWRCNCKCVFCDVWTKDVNKSEELSIEEIVDRYYQCGLRNRLLLGENKNRLLLGENKPNPKCVALADHLRILPNGDVPVCYFNSKIVANVRQTPWSQLRLKSQVKAA